MTLSQFNKGKYRIEFVFKMIFKIFLVRKSCLINSVFADNFKLNLFVYRILKYIITIKESDFKVYSTFI